MPDAKIIRFPFIAPPTLEAPTDDARRVPLPRRVRTLRERGVTGPAVLQALALQAYEKQCRRPPGTTRLDARVRAPTRRAIRDETVTVLYVVALLLCDVQARAPEERDDLAWCLAQVGLSAGPSGQRDELERVVDRVWESVPTMQAVAVRA